MILFQVDLTRITASGKYLACNHHSSLLVSRREKGEDSDAYIIQSALYPRIVLCKCLFYV